MNTEYRNFNCRAVILRVGYINVDQNLIADQRNLRAKYLKNGEEN